MSSQSTETPGTARSEGNGLRLGERHSSAFRPDTRSEAEERQSTSASPPPTRAESSLYCPIEHDTEPEWGYECDRNDIS
jgi:hypothetical protein